MDCWDRSGRSRHHALASPQPMLWHNIIANPYTFVLDMSQTRLRDVTITCVRGPPNRRSPKIGASPLRRLSAASDGAVLAPPPLRAYRRA